MRIKYGVILAVIGYIIFFFCMEGWGANWKLYSENNLNSRYYDTTSITRPSKDVVRVWCKRVHSAEGISEMAKELGKKYEALSYSLEFSEFHCAEKKRRTISVIHYSTDGSVLFNTSDSGPWNFISPESVGEALFKILCK